MPDWVCACGRKLVPYPKGLEIICGTCQSPRHGGFDRCADCDDLIEREGIAT